MSPIEPREPLRTWLHDRQLSGHLWVLATDCYADIEAVLGMINEEDITGDAIPAYMDLPAEGIKDVETLDHGRMSAYYGEYLTTKNM